MSTGLGVWLVRALAATSVGLHAVPAAAQVIPIALPRVAIEGLAGSNADAVSALDAAGTLPFRVAVRLRSTLSGQDPDVETSFSRVATRQRPIWLTVQAPATLDLLVGWQQSLSALLDAHADGLAMLEVALDGSPNDLAVFSVRVAATEARARREAIVVALGGPLMADADRRRAIYTSELAPYVDLLVLPETVEAGAAEWLDRVDPGAGIALTSGPAGSDPADARRRLLDATLEELGTTVLIHSWQATDTLPGALQALSSAGKLLSGEMSAIDKEAADLRLAAGGRDLTTVVRSRLLFDSRTLAAYLICWNDQTQPLEISLITSARAIPTARDLLTAAELTVTNYSRDDATGRVRASVSQPPGLMVVDFSDEGTEPFVDRSGVSARQTLTIGEIIALHQRQQRAQDTVVRNYVARARMEQHFRPTVADPGYDIVTENRYYVDRSGVEWEELSFSVNGSKWGTDRPPLPLLQPEKVLALPLQLRFDEGYRYRLAGLDRIDGYDCYTVRFDPARPDPALYRGTVWIDRATFARIRVQAVQGGLSAPVVSNEETHSYTKVTTIDDHPVFLFTGLVAQQIVLIAGRNLLVEKKATFTDFRVNAAEFDDARGAARASDRIMYRETDAGLRHYVKENGVRVVSDLRTASVKAMALGVTLDPSFAFPLPIFGINYLDFEFGSENTQLALLFGGVLVAANVQRQKLGGSPLDASVDLFAIAVPSSERVYEASGEREAERVMTWPLSTGLNLGYQYTPFQKATAQLQVRFDGYVRDTTTSDSFAVPASTLSVGVGGAWEYRRAGYSVTLNGSWFRRAGWKDWGIDPSGDALFAGAGGTAYAKYGAGMSRDFYFRVFHKLHLNAAWFGGQHLDRFSKYQFGLFDDTRIHGVPASGVRFADLAIVRTSYSLNILEQYRVDAFLEHAWGRDTALDTRWRPISGFGLAANLRGPRSTILRADFGKSLLPDLYGSLGSTTLQLLVLKPLK
ncbi:MAG: hypothetical protein A3H97_15965 [Acidobacteria bacterium RIFCSPLOWO2_02_FULL_65_29]|nr:MAG: hypothetical protein A3H97_15965 [Acidobacteria bacterium RIFCSPLOWO2_02_FULL_65_29]